MNGSGQGVGDRRRFELYAVLVVVLAIAESSTVFPAWGDSGAGACGLAPAAAAAEPRGATEAAAWIERARIRAEQGATGAAIEMLLQRGSAWLGSGQVFEAIQVFEAATELQPESPLAWAYLGRAHTTGRAFDRAEEAFATAVDLGDTSDSTLFGLGAAQWENGDLRSAEVTLRRAIEVSGGKGFFLAQLGRLLLWQGRYAEAADTLGAAVGAGASASYILFDRAEALRGSGRIDEAIGAYRQVTQVAPTLFKAYYGLAVALSRAGRDAESNAEFSRYERFYREDQKRTREHERSLGEMERARSLLHAGETQAALGHLSHLPQSADVLALTAQGQCREGRTEEAVATLERAVSLDPGRADLRRLLSGMRTALGDKG